MDFPKDYEVEGQMSIFDLGIWSGKTSPEPLVRTKAKTFEWCLKKLQELRIKPPLYLDLRKGNGQTAEPSWEMGGALLGEYMTRSFGECPRDVKESRLSQILEETPHPKYCLSAKACQGILRRAEKRGKELPPMLKEALERQSASKNEEESRGAVKESSSNTSGQEHCPPLTTNQCLNSWDVQSKHIQPETGIAEALYSGECRGGGGESYVMQSKVFGISSYNSNAMKSSNPHSGVYEADTARTLDLNGGSPACNQGGMMIVQGIDGYNQQSAGNVSKPLSNAATDSDHVPIVCIEGNGSRPSHRGDGYAESDTMYTLNGTEHHAVAYGIDQQGGKGGAAYTVDVAPTMASNSHGTPHAVCVENHPADSRVQIKDDGIVQTLSGRMGTGGGNVPLLMDTQQTTQVKIYSMGYDIRSAKFTDDEITDPLTATDYKDPIKINDCRRTYQDITGTLDCCIAKGTGNQLANSDMFIANTSVVRRLTPLEYERLQGYPDGWTNIGEWVDSKGKKHKDADSPRYKALGNSIALPFWEWMAARMVKYIDHKPTMASLFDGIGGFPLVFSRCGCTPIWASEIEEFPMAVTKLRFPSEEEQG